jgi:hypothetical protein
MKALQLRKRNMLLSQRATSELSAAPSNSIVHHISESSISTTGSGKQNNNSQDPLENIDEESRPTASPYTNSPTVATQMSEDPSTKASSLSEQYNTSRSQRSLSSATSSSLTPKAPLDDVNPNIAMVDGIDPATAQHRPVPARVNDIQGDINVALAYLEKAPTPGDPSELTTEHSPSDLPARQLSPCPQSFGQVRVPSKRRQPAPEPLRIIPTNNVSTSDVSDDDSLIDEIHNATVHEAKPVSVARTPVTPIISKGSSDRLKDMTVRPPGTSHSIGRRSETTSTARGRSTSGSMRSTSGALPTWPPLPTETDVQQPLTRKAALGSGITNRIKALEISRTKGSSPPRPPEPVRATSAGTSAFSAFMKRSSLVGAQQQKPNASTENSPPKTLPRSGPSYEHFPSSRTSHESQRATPRGETISVTARIVREPGTKPGTRRPPLAPSSNYHTPLNLYRSPLIVEHGKSSKQVSEAPTEPVRLKSPTKSEKGRFSFSSHRSMSHPNLPKSESSQSKFSKANKRHGPRSISDAASLNEDKSRSSMSRLIKRVSNLAGSRSKNQLLKEEEKPFEQAEPIQNYPEMARDDSVTESMLHVVDIGDVNVQFPESLLWKRRFMRVDDQGYLIFSPPASEGNAKANSRKYHLGDFGRPALPDYEREEMAWSVVLDLKDGRCVQCACESRRAQQQVLQSKLTPCVRCRQN